MPTIEELMTKSLNTAYTRTGKTVQYTPDGKWPVSIPAIITYGKGYAYRGSGSYGGQAIMRVRVSDIATVTKMDQVTIDGYEWSVVGGPEAGIPPQLSSDGLEWIVCINKVS